MANLKNVIYLTNEDYETLVTTGTVIIDGETLTYDENNLYITPNTLASPTEDGLMSAEDKAKLDSLPNNFSGIYRHTLTLFANNDQPITVFSTKSTPYTLEELYAGPIFINCYTIGGPFHNGGHFWYCYQWFEEGEGIIFEPIDGEPISQPIRTDGAAIDTVTQA